MPQGTWSQKREWQYDRIKGGFAARGGSVRPADQIAARNGLALAGEARAANTTSASDLSSARRDGLRSHRGPGSGSYRQLYAEARRKGVKGRSRMDKADLEKAVSGA
jgi:hypothetical protein